MHKVELRVYSSSDCLFLPMTETASTDPNIVNQLKQKEVKPS